MPAGSAAPASFTVGHFPTLDGLRGIAILLVIGHHVLQPVAGGPAIADPITRLASFGWVGVDLSSCCPAS